MLDIAFLFVEAPALASCQFEWLLCKHHQLKGSTSHARQTWRFSSWRDHSNGHVARLMMHPALEKYSKSARGFDHSPLCSGACTRQLLVSYLEQCMLIKHSYNLRMA